MFSVSPRRTRRLISNLAAGALLALLFAAAPVPAKDAPAEARATFSEGRQLGNATQSGVKPAPTAAPRTKQRDVVRQSLDSAFYIYDAFVDLYFDDDGDGHYFGIDVTFDADTDYIAAEVYAVLYLSFENGPWIEYFVTDYFTLLGASGSDDYLVETELVDGYPTGYYDLLIELYDADDYLVASFGPADSSELAVLPLEDLQKDAPVDLPPPVPSVPVSSSRGGGGASGALVVLGLGALLALRRRRDDYRH